MRKSTYFQLLLLTTFVLEVVPEWQTEKKTTCGIRHLEGRDMMLTCYFHEDISDAHRGFTVYLYTGQPSPITVTSCDWFLELSCNVHPAYKYDQVIYRDHTNIWITNAAEMHLGTYTCQVNGETNPGNCGFTASQIPPHLPAPISYLEQTTKTVPTFALTTAATSTLPDDLQTQRTDEQSSAEAGFPAASTTAATSALPDDLQTQRTDEQSSAEAIFPAASTTAATSALPDDLQTQSIDEQSSGEAGFPAAEGQDTAGTQEDNIVIPVSVPVAALVLIIILIVISCRRRRRQKESRKADNEENDGTDTEQKEGLLTQELYTKECKSPRSLVPPPPETNTERQTSGGHLASPEEDEQQTPLTLVNKLNETEQEVSLVTESLSTTGHLKRHAVQPEDRMELKQN